ncbi:hypothetical protein COU77_03015 [Candidatus Peregrinibacteria bacterium CG10_big_fil_rev_8_21_14_0_10_49_16]|nr:MAG: hypothetical protein COW95_02530 [Candidatus Peregrinibacteria bacterium CG22_combo_CG10-13_8_21_14_all_49_11]PIR52004.1 MAG: hypothetical protein COU77_03015 [Candidatus Peregrinibacteria bacterium CG10_big_fil_rev_8_21_14_0_10_49_16]
MRQFALLLVGFALLIPEVHAQTVTVDDTIVGLSTSIQLEGFQPREVLTLHVRSPEDEELSLQGQTDDVGNAHLALPGYALEKAGVYTIRITPTNIQAQFTVHPESIDTKTSFITAERATIIPNGTDELTVQVTLFDQYENPLPTRPVALISNRTEDSVSEQTKETNANGIQYFTVRTQREGVLTLRAMDLLSGQMLDDSFAVRTQSTAGPVSSSTTKNPSWRILTAQAGKSFDVIDHFEITVPDQMQVGIAAQSFAIRAVDRDGRSVENYDGEVEITTTDPDADVPFKQGPNKGLYKFQESDQGERKFALALTFYSPGTHTIRVQDKKQPETIFGEKEITVTGKAVSPGGKSIRITSHKDGDTVNSAKIMLEGQGPSYIDVRIMGGKEDVITDTNNLEGTFSAEIELHEDHREFTIRVQDINNPKTESAPIHLFLDNEPPDIQSITFSPEKPTAESSVLAIVITEPELSSVTMRLKQPQEQEEKEFTLKETENPGTYQTLFSVGPAGTYQPRITAVDDAGNSTKIQSMFSVNPKPLSQVQNLQAAAEGNAAALTWDAVEEEVDEYRIYVGESPNDYLYNLDTGRSTTKANVSGLQPGKTYYFAVTALQGDAESPEKSEQASVTILGLTLMVSPQDSALLLEWPSLPASLPLSSFFLEYGTQEGTYTEKRTLNGELRAYTLRDLINGFTYYIRLTPIDITGDIMEELTALGQGTPQGSGVFQPSDPPPSVPGTVIGPDGTPLPPTVSFPQTPEDLPSPMTPSPPTLSEDGLPSFVLWSMALIAGILFVLHRHRKHRLQQTIQFFDAIQAQRRI